MSEYRCNLERYNLTWIDEAIKLINEWLKVGFKPINTKISRNDTLAYKIHVTEKGLKAARSGLVALACYPEGLTQDAFDKYLKNDSIILVIPNDKDSKNTEGDEEE